MFCFYSCLLVNIIAAESAGKMAKKIFKKKLTFFNHNVSIKTGKVN